MRGKGFTYNSLYENYKGQFNGKNVEVYIHTNHNLVDRVYVSFLSTIEENIRIDFNRLLSQFKKNSKYMDLSTNEQIPDNDDISYEITVNKKRYQASFSYFDPERDPLAFANALIDKFDGNKAFLFLATLIDGMKSLADGEVWFMIHENYGHYNIGLYYDNLHNQANGEDL